MASFDPDSVLSHPVDYLLVANGFVTLFWDRQVLDDTLEWLGQHGYRIVKIEASAWHTESDMHDGVALALSFPDYYGRNLNALNDCLRDVAAADYALTPDDTGIVLVLLGFDQFFHRDPYAAHKLLDYFADQARSAALVGYRMLCLVQSDDAHLVVPSVGATPVSWNGAEWLDSHRRR